ncbi:ABC transporter permease [Sulfurifustis variabilis]|uniref:ABC transporter permease n=1 Tax=Sulfurifustis variabilis TaxID=1675686 RepID=A0A1B4VDX9_9GAMM|nr:FtsX-like permease family protein [Sulfurifustis variabilis]BAU48767.1 ABC transporter permease [Sulfurifustis variabilis]
MNELGLLATLAWRNLWRHRWRTVVILFALALGIWSMVTLGALSRGSLEQQLAKAILNLTGHVQIHAPAYRDDPVIEHRLPAPPPALGEVLDGPGVRAWAARVRVPAVISSERESAGVVLVGIEPRRERGLSFIADAVTEGRYLESPDDPGLLLGRKLAERLETALGRRVVLMSQDVANDIADRGFRVIGIFDASPEAIETGYVFVGRAVAQDLLGLGDAVSEIALVAPDRERLGPVLADLRRAAPDADVQPWTRLEPLLVLTENVTDVVLVIWYVIVFVAMSFGMVNTLLMAVFERTREFGLFQALGMPPRQILLQVLLESVILLLCALALGNAAAWATLRALEGGIDLSAFAEGLELVGVSPVIYPALSPGDATIANALVFVLGLAASLYPAWRAARYVPVEAITRA